MTVSHLTYHREMRHETVTAKSLTSVSRKSHETHVRLYEAKRSFFAGLFPFRFSRVFRQKSHVSHPYREVILRLSSKFAPFRRNRLAMSGVYPRTRRFAAIQGGALFPFGERGRPAVVRFSLTSLSCDALAEIFAGRLLQYALQLAATASVQPNAA